MVRRTVFAVSNWFEHLEHAWESQRALRLIGSSLVVVFLIALAVIELNIRNMLPPFVAARLPRNHFHAIETAFTLLLLVEIAGLIFGLGRSVSNAVGKQFEILSLILLRQSFKEFIYFDEPIVWSQVQASLVPMLSDAIGALLVFVVLGFYYRAQRHIPITADAEEQASFVAAKRLVAVGLLLAFVLIGMEEIVRTVTQGGESRFFETFYTLMIFTDVLIVLISLRYSSTYHVVFRNSGYAVVTVFIRLALIAPPPFNALLGLGTILFALGLTRAYNALALGLARLPLLAD